MQLGKENQYKCEYFKTAKSSSVLQTFKEMYQEVVLLGHGRIYVTWYINTYCTRGRGCLWRRRLRPSSATRRRTTPCRAGATGGRDNSSFNGFKQAAKLVFRSKTHRIQNSHSPSFTSNFTTNDTCSLFPSTCAAEAEHHGTRIGEKKIRSKRWRRSQAKVKRWLLWTLQWERQQQRHQRRKEERQRNNFHGLCLCFHHGETKRNNVQKCLLKFENNTFSNFSWMLDTFLGI